MDNSTPTKKKRAKKKSPTARTMEELKDSGYICGVVERYNSFIHQRFDLFGCIDLIAMPPANMGLNKLIGIQCCIGGDHAAHRDKCLAESRLSDWLRCGNIFEIRSWSQKGARGKKKTWEPRVERFELRGGLVVSTSGENENTGNLDETAGCPDEELVSLF